MNDAPAQSHDRRTNVADTPAGLMDATLSSIAARAVGGPPWLETLRREGARVLETRGFPAPNEEAWRFTPIRPVLRVPYAHGARRDPSAPLPPALVAVDAPSVVLVNGRPSGAVPSVPGLEIRSLAEVLARSPDRLEPFLGRLAPAKDGFSAANLALFDDGVVLVAERGKKVGPVHLRIVSAPGAGPTLATPRILVVAEPGSELDFVETRMTMGASPHFESAVTEVFVERGARVEHVRVHHGDSNSASVARVAVDQAEDGRYTSRAFTFGGALSRLEIEVALRGEGAECVLDGMYLSRTGNLVDHQTTIDHARPRCSSRERYKGIIDGSGVAVFDGTIVVRPGASGTAAHQENRNLCLSPDAIVHTKPHLEIDTDDVKCSHGATVGRLDQAQLFYLRARGMDGELARSVLTYAFAREMIQPISNDTLRATLEARLADLLPSGAAARELA